MILNRFYFREKTDEFQVRNVTNEIGLIWWISSKNVYLLGSFMASMIMTMFIAPIRLDCFFLSWDDKNVLLELIKTSTFHTHVGT